MTAALVGQEREGLLGPLVESVVHDLAPVAHDADTRLAKQVPGDLGARGPGIAPEQLEEGFEKSGIDGRVSVESTEGLGSTFRFTLPAGQGAASSRAA